MLTTSELNTLEGLIDKHGLTSVINAIGILCFAKAEHIRLNWQDNVTAKAWDNAGFRVHNLTDLSKRWRTDSFKLPS